ncbi:MAG: amidohydrolase family protein [Oscillospiraceae bacterium]|nr:amidohydrolase family protein [Oscillospiraceae bacterium]
MKCYHGDILTVNGKDEVCSWLVEDGGKIVFVGNELPERYRGAELVELGGKALCPSFADTHQHLASFSAFHAGLNVMDAASNREISEMVRDFVRRSSAKTLIAFGASPYSVEEGRLLSRAELDAVCPDRPMMVVKYDGHACIINTPLLKKLEKKLAPLRGYHPDTGEMNQEAFFKVSDYITNSLSPMELVKNLQNAVDFEASRGIGMVHTVSGIGFVVNLDITLEQFFARSLTNGFQVRVFPQSLDIRAATRRKLPRIGGCFACALDGCFGSHDAAMNEPYTDDGAGGVLYYSDEKVTEFCKKANRAGLQIEMHAIGDRAFDQAARALRAALDDFPREDHRHGIIHACLPTETGLQICRDYHIQLPVQSAFINWKQEPDAYLERILGAERTAALNPLRTFWDMGIRICAGSDAPCTAPNPVDWIDKAVNHANPAQALTVPEALRMCTINGYRATFDEAERGSLEVGKIADMVMLSENPCKMEPARLHELRVEQLLLGGKPYESCRRGVAGAMLKGMFSRAKA